MADSTSTRPSRRRRFGAIVAPIGLLLAGCANDAELDSLDPKGDNAQAIDKLIGPIFIIAGIVLALVAGATLYMAYRFRASRHPHDEWPEQNEGNTTLEILWTMIPTVLLAGIGVFSLIALVDLNDTDANAFEVEVDGETVSWEPTVVVVGQQWWWEFRYYFDGIDITDIDHANDLPPADIVTATQMVIPAGQEIELHVTSRDVLHSFWIPPLNGKRDAVPGRFSPWEVSADEPGTYFGTCTEFCGLSHSRMQMEVIAVTDEQFQTWVTEQMTPYTPESVDAQEYLAAVAAGDTEAVAPTATAEERGMTAFRTRCSSCHLLEGVNDDLYDPAAVAEALVSEAAPNLTHFASRTRFAGGTQVLYNEDGTLAVNNLEAWLRNPSAVKDMAPGEGRGMPNLGLSETEIDDLVAFLATTGAPPDPANIEQAHVD